MFISVQVSAIRQITVVNEIKYTKYLPLLWGRWITKCWQRSMSLQCGTRNTT